MSTLIKVTFLATSGEEVSGKAKIDRPKGLVTLPTRISASIDRAKSAGEGFEVVAHDNGYLYPLLHVSGSQYRLDASSRQRHGLLSLAWRAITAPHKDQRQQYGRFAHTLSAAALIGFVGYVNSVPAWSLYAALQAFCLFSGGVVLFMAGAVLAKGD
ncbi:hypothetical protein [Cupriavidus pampae]|uniref:Uncharacterized protein n=1 Tax=Cupriavidus pampae TaxID=659251 RepID=A0ABM8Y0H2_9BURK|nr:hypothetical protein [Cupriavidus pampae]CAG9186082.1 hypothetical protein LMG32289_06251 [Cupriavidus pampae]